MHKHLTATALALILALQLSPAVLAQDSGSDSNGSDSSDTGSDTGNQDDGSGSDTTDGEGDRGEGDTSDDQGTAQTTDDDGELNGDPNQDDKAGTTGTATSTPTDASEDAPGTRGATVGQPQQPTIATDSDNPIWGMRGEQVIGQTVYGADGEEIGQIEDVVGGPSATRADAVVSVGGFLGIGERNVVIPMNRIQSDGDRLTSDMTRAEIEAMQPYEQGSYQPWDRSRTLGGTGQ